MTKVAEVATEVATKAIRRVLTQEDQQRLFEESMNELRAAGQERQDETAGIRS